MDGKHARRVGGHWAQIIVEDCHREAGHRQACGARLHHVAQAVVVVHRHEDFGLAVVIVERHAQDPLGPPHHLRVERFARAAGDPELPCDRRHRPFARGHHQPIHGGRRGEAGDALRANDTQCRIDAEAAFEEGGGAPQQQRGRWWRKPCRRPSRGQPRSRNGLRA